MSSVSEILIKAIHEAAPACDSVSFRRVHAPVVIATLIFGVKVSPARFDAAFVGEVGENETRDDVAERYGLTISVTGPDVMDETLNSAVNEIIVGIGFGDQRVDIEGTSIGAACPLSSRPEVMAEAAKCACVALGALGLLDTPEELRAWLCVEGVG